jgi:hypothetical protein
LIVDKPGQQFFADTGFAGDQHSAACPGDAFSGFHDLRYRLAFANEGVVGKRQIDLISEIHIFFLKLPFKIFVFLQPVSKFLFHELPIRDVYGYPQNTIRCP